jgi:hypothetical protein
MDYSTNIIFAFKYVYSERAVMLIYSFVSLMN